MEDSDDSATRVRKACEPCRRKKAKCPAEKPSCSTCTRLGTKCAYRKVEGTSRVQKQFRTNTRDEHGNDRFQQLEARVESIMDTLRSFSQSHVVPATNTIDKHPVGAGSSLHSSSSTYIESRHRPSASLSTQSINYQAVSVGAHKFNAANNATPSTPLLQSLLMIYQYQIDNQPLEIFGSQPTSLGLIHSSPMLLHSFLSLLVHFTNDDFYKDSKASAIEFYRTSAIQTLLPQAMQMTVNTEILQSFCFLTMSLVEDGLLSRAMMMIGLGARLVNCTSLISNRAASSISADLRRGAWNILILEKTYGSSFKSVPAFPAELELPQGMLLSTSELSFPHKPQSHATGEFQSAPLFPGKVYGIHEFCLKLLLIWSQLMSCLQEMQLHGIEEPWNRDSGYQKTSNDLRRAEVLFANTHRYAYVGFAETSGQDLASNRTYWAPWVRAQILYHSIIAVLHHPVLYQTKGPGCLKAQSPTFLQHVTDQAILHSSWVTRILQLCREKSFEIFDPFIGHLLCCAATIHLLMRFSRDTDLATTAMAKFGTSREILVNLAKMHPHLRFMMTRLDRLSEALSESGVGPDNTSQNPRTRSCMLWELLDYASSTSASPRINDDTVIVELNMDTSPLQPLSTDTSAEQRPATHDLGPSQIDIDLGVWGDTLLEFDMSDFIGFQDMTAFDSSRGVW